MQTITVFSLSCSSSIYLSPRFSNLWEMWRNLLIVSTFNKRISSVLNFLISLSLSPFSFFIATFQILNMIFSSHLTERLTSVNNNQQTWFDGSQVYIRVRWRGTMVTPPIETGCCWDPNLNQQQLRRRPTSCCSGGTRRGSAAWNTRPRTTAIRLATRPVQDRLSGQPPLPGSTGGS